MKIGDKIYAIGNSGTLIVEEIIKKIYTVNDVTIYDTGKRGIAFDETAIGENIFLTETEAKRKCQRSYNQVEVLLTKSEVD